MIGSTFLNAIFISDQELQTEDQAPKIPGRKWESKACEKLEQ